MPSTCSTSSRTRSPPSPPTTPTPAMSITAESSTRPTVLDATALIPTDPTAAEAILKEIVGRVAGPKDDELLREKESAIIKLGEIYRERKYVCARGRARGRAGAWS